MILEKVKIKEQNIAVIYNVNTHKKRIIDSNRKSLLKRLFRW